MNKYYEDDLLTLLHGDALEQSRTLDSGSAQTIVTSPPYFGLRSYSPDAVQLRDDLSEDDRSYVLSELARLGIGFTMIYNLSAIPEHLRSYFVPAELGAESSVAEYVANMVTLFTELRRVLADDGTLWLNLGDSYTASLGQRKVTDKAGAKQESKRGSTGSPSTFIPGIAPKNLIGIPWRVAFALQADGWILRSEIIWAKPNPMPESVTDRPTKAHETIFLFSKRPRYYYNADAIAEPTKKGAAGSRFDIGKTRRDGTSTKARIEGDLRNKSTVWTVPTIPFSAAHFAVYPPELIRPCILAGSRPGDTVLDPFSGSGTTGMVATQEGRKYIGIDLNADYLDLSLRTRFASPVLDMTGGDAA